MRESRISVNWLFNLWPGLPDAWMRGRIEGLLIALGFAIVLEAALITSFVWPLWFGPFTRTVVWFCVAMYWLVGTVPALVRGTQNFGNTSGRLGLFRQAQAEYLSGNWFGAERLLQQLLGTDETDADVRLMLATLYRRIRRWDAARRQLTLVTTYDQQGKWQLEVSRERILLGREAAKQKQTPMQNRADESDGHVSGAA